MAKVMPVFFSYTCKADSKSARKRVDPDMSAISQVRKKVSSREGVTPL
jgi:hypothetical protein